MVSKNITARTNSGESEAQDSVEESFSSSRQLEQLKGARYRLDDLERSIVKQLLDDARKPFQGIARELGIDEKTVRNRVSKLREKGVLRFTPTTNPNRLKGCIVAMIAVNVRPDMRNNLEALAKRIADLPMVSWVGSVMGHYDLLLEVVVDSWESLSKFELSDLPSIEGVGQTDSFLVLTHYGSRGVAFVDAILNPRT